MTSSDKLLQILLTSLAPIFWGSTYIVTTELLPADMPLTASTIRALPAGLLLLLFSPGMPKGAWWGKITLLATLNIGFFFYCLFLAAYYLPGGTAALLMSCQPLFVIILSTLFLKSPLSRYQIMAFVLGLTGIALLVLKSSVALNWQGVIAGLVAAITMAVGLVLTKKWGRPEGMSLLNFTGWQLAIGGGLLLPFMLYQEGIPTNLNLTNILGYTYLCFIGAVFSYMLWFRGLTKLPAVTMSFLGFLSSLSACILGWLILGESLTSLQLLGGCAILGSVYLSGKTPLIAPPLQPTLSSAKNS